MPINAITIYTLDFHNQILIYFLEISLFDLMTIFIPFIETRMIITFNLLVIVIIFSYFIHVIDVSINLLTLLLPIITWAINFTISIQVITTTNMMINFTIVMITIMAIIIVSYLVIHSITFMMVIVFMFM